MYFLTFLLLHSSRCSHNHTLNLKLLQAIKKIPNIPCTTTKCLDPDMLSESYAHLNKISSMYPIGVSMVLPKWCSGGGRVAETIKLNLISIISREAI